MKKLAAIGLLVAILAVAPLAEGDAVSFSGAFAWNPKGGVVHWTHNDPAGHHPAGWIRRDGQIFQ